jgi:hypothetical protein
MKRREEKMKICSNINCNMLNQEKYSYCNGCGAPLIEHPNTVGKKISGTIIHLLDEMFPEFNIGFFSVDIHYGTNTILISFNKEIDLKKEND